LSAVRSDLDTLQKDVRGLVSEVGGVASREVQGAMGGAIHSAQEAVERIWSKENGGGMRDVLRNQPVAACVLSLGAGAIIGALCCAERILRPWGSGNFWVRRPRGAASS
jgi:hypothetical protein